MCETFTCCSGEKLNTKLKINEYINKSKCRRRRRHKNKPRKQKETAKKNQNERNTKVLAQRAQQLPFTAAENSGPSAPLALSPSDRTGDRVWTPIHNPPPSPPSFPPPFCTAPLFYSISMTRLLW